MIESILQGFEVWTDAQGLKSKGRVKSIDNISLEGIAKLKELILDLAIRGKLVNQDENEETANVLLRNIRIEKDRLKNESGIGKTGIFIEVDDDIKPFELPQNWEWTFIRNIGHDWGQKTPDKSFTYIDVSSINNEIGEITNPSILKANEAPSRARKIVKQGTVIYSTVRPYLKNICVINEEYSPEPIASTAFAIIHPYLQMPGKYFYYFFRSPFFIKYVESVQTGIAYPAINDKQFFNALIPLPPLEEQKRIVHKIDELMALCNKLEERQTTNLTTHHNLVKSLLETLTNAADADELQVAWEKLSEHFDTLFSTEDSIDQLRQTLLELVIAGRFKTQRENDTPAHELYKLIEAELTEKFGKQYSTELKRDASTIDPSELHFPIPATWLWCELQDLAILFNGKAHEQFVDEKGDYILVNSSFVSSEGRSAKYVTSQLTPLNKGNIAMVMSDVPGGKALVKCFLVEEDDKYSLNQRIGGIETSSHIDINYLFLVLNRNRYYLQYDDGRKQTNLKKIQILSCPIPLPPIEEQGRIVEKAKELLELCDRLSDRIVRANEINQALSKTIVEVIS